MNNKQIEGLAQDALNEAVKFMQVCIGVHGGDFASVFFSDDAVQKIFAEYIRGEILYKEMSDE